MNSGQTVTAVTGIVKVVNEPRMLVLQNLQPAEFQMDKPLVISVVRKPSEIFAAWTAQTLLYALVAVLLTGAGAAALLLNQRHRASVREGLRSLESELHENEQWVLLTADAVHYGVWVNDLVRDEIRASDQWKDMFDFASTMGLRLDDVLHRIHPDDREPFSQALLEVRNGVDGYKLELRVVKPDGGLRWIASRGCAEFDADGNAILTRGVSIDITEQKRAEAERLQRHRELTHLSRVAMLGGLSGAMAHELNQPLTAILSNAQAAQRFLEQDDVDLQELREILSDIVSEDKRAGEVIRRLRLLLSPSEMQRDRTDLNELISEVGKLLRSDLVNRRVILRLELAEALPEVRADRVQLQQVMINLMVNACDAIRDLPEEQQQFIVRTGYEEGEGVRVSVIDSGPGISDDLIDKVFESFVTTKTGGMGLGLSVCRSIIQAHDGRIWAESHPGSGASFHFILPALGPRAPGP
jgi:C4-dicarboxylate-specific signal transduction histidine kinase